MKTVNQRWGHKSVNKKLAKKSKSKQIRTSNEAEVVETGLVISNMNKEGRERGKSESGVQLSARTPDGSRDAAGWQLAKAFRPQPFKQLQLFQLLSNCSRCKFQSFCQQCTKAFAKVNTVKD